MRTALVAVLAALPFATLAQQFDYNAKLPLTVRATGASAVDGGGTLTTLSYSIDGVHRMRAALVRPAGSGPFAAVVLVPGRFQHPAWFMPEVIALAHRGAIAISLDDLGGAYPLHTEADRPLTIRRVIAVRRAIDLLLARRDVDPKRVAVVGHSDGAELAGIVAGVDHRIAAAVLMAGGGVWDSDSRPWYEREMVPLDSWQYVAHAAPTPLFFQSALRDEYVPRDDALFYQRSASMPKRVQWYDTHHVFGPRAFRDNENWLAGLLHLR